MLFIRKRIKKQKLVGFGSFLATLVLVGSLVSYVRGAGNGTFSLTASPTTVNTGSTFDVTVRLNSGSQGIDYVDVRLTYNPAQVRYETMIFDNSAFESGLDFGGANGAAYMQRGTTDVSSTGNQIVGVVRFTMLASSGSSQITVGNTSEQGYFDGQGVYQDYWNHGSVSTTVNVTPPADVTGPSVPGNLHTTTAPTTTSVSLAWNASTDPSGIQRYEIFRNGSKVGDPTTTSYTDSTGLVANTQYTYTVRAIDNSPNHNASNPTAGLPVTTASNPTPPADTTNPTVPSTIRTTSIGQTTVDLTWNGSTDASGIARYEVYRDGTKVGDPTNTSYSDSGLTANTKYSYTIKAVDNSTAHNTSGASDTLEVTTVAADGSGGTTTVVDTSPEDTGSGSPTGTTRPNPIPSSLPAATPQENSPISSYEPQNVQYKKATIGGELSRPASVVVEYGFVDIDGNDVRFVSSAVNASGTYQIVLDASSLIPGITYYYQVVATESNGTVHRSEARTFSTPGFTVHVTVKDKNEKPLKNQKVVLHSDPMEEETDKNGFVEFTNVSPGSHEVQAVFGSQTVATAIEVVDNVLEVDGVQTAEPQTFAVTLPAEQQSSGWLIWAIPSSLLMLLAAAGVITFIRRRGGLPPLAFGGNNPSLPTGGTPVVGGFGTTPPPPTGMAGSKATVTPGSKEPEQSLEDRLNHVPGATTFAPGQVIAPKETPKDE